MIVRTTTPAVSAVTDFTSGPMDVGDMRAFSFQGIFSGSNVVGTLKFQASNDGSTWVDISGASFAITASGDIVMDFAEVGFRYIRYDWDYTSGTGNITVVFVGKGSLPRSIR